MMLGWPVVAVANWLGRARLVTAAAGIWSGWGAGTWRGSGCLAGRCCLAGTWLAGASGGWLCSVASGCGRAGGSDLGRAGADVVLSGTGLAGGLGAWRDGAGVKLAIRTSEIGDDAGIKRLAGMLAKAGAGAGKRCWQGRWRDWLADVLANGWRGPLAMRGWLKSTWWLASLAIWLSRRMAGGLAACGLLILACLQSLYSVYAVAGAGSTGKSFKINKLTVFLGFSTRPF